MARKRIKYGCYGTFFTGKDGNLYYKVAKNDTLWTIAQKYYGKGIDWTKIYNLNKDKIKNPHWIYPNQVFLIKKADVKKVDQSKKPPVPPKWTGGQYMEELPLSTYTVYEYISGIKDIDIKANQYHTTAAFVTGDVIKNKNIRYIEIEAHEEHPIIENFKDNKYATSIEYYVSYDNKEWIPIHPKNHEKVENEMIIFIGSSGTDQTGELRFYPDLSKPLDVYYNGNKLSKNKYSVLGKTITIKNAAGNVGYTVSYYPDKKRTPEKIVIDKETIESNLVIKEQIFHGTDGNFRVILDDVPYIKSSYRNIDFDPNVKADDEGICIPIEVEFRNADITDKNRNKVQTIRQYGNESIKLKNITDYYNKTIKKPKEFDPINYPYIEFYHNGKEIIFSDTFRDSDEMANIEFGKALGNADIVVKYAVPNISVKVKAILRITSNDVNNNVTPVIKSIQIYGWCIE